MKLRITIDGKTYDVGVEVVESEDSAPEYPSYPPPPPAFVPSAVSEPPNALITNENPGNEKECRSPVTGMVIEVNVETGQTVQSSDVVIVIESMKMEMQITAPQAGVVKNVLVTPGSSVKVNQLLMELE